VLRTLISYTRQEITFHVKLHVISSSIVHYSRIQGETQYCLTCSFPHSLHLSQPTQSMMREMLRKCCRNSSFNSRACCPPLNIVLSLKWSRKDLPKTMYYQHVAHSQFHTQKWPRKTAKISNIFVEKLNRARKVKSLAHKRATRKVFHHRSPFHCTST
jgi:hypothetical protein